MKTNIAKQSKKYPHHRLLVHNIHTTNKKLEKKGEKVWEAASSGLIFIFGLSTGWY